VPGSWLLLALGAGCLLAAVNSWRPRRAFLLVLPSWFLAFVVTELALHLVVVGALVVAALVVLADAGGSAVGAAGLVLWVIAAGLVLPHVLGSMRTVVDVQGGGATPVELHDAPRYPWWWIVLPVLMFWRRGVAHERGVVYATVDGRDLKLDAYRPVGRDDGPRPAVLHLHGGAWFFGSRHEQGVPLLNHLAANGWVGFNVDYRLSPQATLPEHVEDVKRAIAFVRANAERFGVDPSFIAITGGSAGGHLSALAALTAGDASLQPGFEDVDCSVQAAVPVYGIYDFLAGHHLPALAQICEWIVIKARADREPERFRRVSPLHRVHADAPPFLVVQGTSDSLVPVAESRAFVAALREVSREAALGVELVGAQHAFDAVPTVRSARTTRVIERFLHASWVAHRTDAPHDAGALAQEELTAAS